MNYLQDYLDKLESRSESLAMAVKKTSLDITEKHIKNFTYNEHIVSLLLGNVQSGKTSHLLGLICSAAQEGFRLFILLTTDNSLLQKQTLYRAKEELNNFCICGESDEFDFRQNNMRRPTIIVLKKNGKILKRWKNNFSSTHYLEANPLLIIDDEGDAASLNTKINQEDQSTINRELDAIKNMASSSIYLQVTGTPQALFLQTESSGWKPNFTYYFEPGDGYIGGDTFFADENHPYVILTDNDEDKDILKDDEFAENGLKQAVAYHLISSADIFIKGGEVSNFLIHPSMKTTPHQKFAEKAGEYLNDFERGIDEPETINAFHEIYDDLKTTKSDIAEFSKVMEFIRKTLADGAVEILVINSKTDFNKNTQYDKGINIIIGGNSLGRGITFPKLQTTYYCRVSKRPQADTMWQHARMFGYDRDKGLMRVFMPPILFKLFADINSTNNSIISQVQKEKPETVLINYNSVSPTRSNVIDKNALIKLYGGVNYFPFTPINKSIPALDEILKPFTQDLPYSANLRKFIEILQQITAESGDWNSEDFVNILQSLISLDPAAQGKLIVRRERNIGKGTGTLLSATDRELGDSITDVPALTMYKITGEKEGWNNEKLWIPNIKLPNNKVYYIMKE